MRSDPLHRLGEGDTGDLSHSGEAYCSLTSARPAHLAKSHRSDPSPGEPTGAAYDGHQVAVDPSRRRDKTSLLRPPDPDEARLRVITVGHLLA